MEENKTDAQNGLNGWQGEQGVDETLVSQGYADETILTDDNLEEFSDKNGKGESIEMDITKQQITESTITGDVVIGNSDKSQHTSVVITSVDTLADEDKVFPCPNCRTLLDGSSFGKIVCHVCKKPSFRLNTKLPIRQYTTIADKNDEEKYKKVLNHINNKLKDANYNAAFRYCLMAEELAPGEPDTWEYFALTEFYREMQRMERRLSVYAIIAIVKVHLSKCLDYGMESERYELVAGDVANKLFNQLRKDVNRYYQLYSNQKNEKLSNVAVNALKAFELCYSLYNDITFLIAYVAELSKDYKWLVQTRDGAITELPFCGKFRAAFNRERVIAKIKDTIPDYCAPEIKKERFEFLGELPGKKIIILSTT